MANKPLTNEQVALLVSKAIEKLQEHDNLEGNHALIDEATELLFEVINNIPLGGQHA